MSTPSLDLKVFIQRTEICRHWVKGHCRWGDKCRFSHQTIASSDEANKKKKALGHSRKNTSKTASGCRDISQFSKTWTIAEFLRKKNVKLGVPEIAKIEANAKAKGICMEDATKHPNSKTQKTIQGLVFHHDTVPQIEIVIENYLSERNNLLQEFFAKGAGGGNLFLEHIVSYLSVKDLVACCQTGRTLHRLCRTYTVPELLVEKRFELPKSSRVELGITVMGRVTQYGGIHSQRPTRIITNSPTESFRAKLYHPRELVQVHQIIDKFLNAFGIPKVASEPDSSDGLETEGSVRNRARQRKPVLISAHFGPKVIRKPTPNPSPWFDVTDIIKKLVTEEGETRLVLRPPPPILDGLGRPKRAPVTFQWWYTRLFGDPCPHTTKQLVLTVRDQSTRRKKKLVFDENREVDIALCIRSK